MNLRTVTALILALLILVPRAQAYRDLETGVFLTRDPAGFVDGPNLYTYVNQNPWTKFDPEGLQEEVLIGAQADRMMARSKPWSRSDTVGAALYLGIAAAPIAIAAAPAAISITTTAKVTLTLQQAAVAYATNPVVHGAVNAVVVGTVTYAETKDPQAAVVNGVFTGIEGYASTPSGKTGSQTRQLTAEELKTYDRVEPRQSTRTAVADANTGPDGKLYDAVTGKEIKPGTPWVMGHKPGVEFRKMQQEAADRGISRQEFIDEQNNPNIYQPEHHSTSSRGAHEAPEHISVPAASTGGAHEDKY